MIPSAPLDEVTTALLTLLRTSGRTIYDAEYDGDPLAPAYPFGILHAIPGGSSDATPDLGFTRQVVVVVHQLTVVSDHRNQTQRVTSSLRDLFLTGDLPLPAEWMCPWRDLDDSMPGVDRVGSHPNTVYNVHSGLRLGISPA